MFAVGAVGVCACQGVSGVGEEGGMGGGQGGGWEVGGCGVGHSGGVGVWDADCADNTSWLFEVYA